MYKINNNYYNLIYPRSYNLHNIILWICMHVDSLTKLLYVLQPVKLTSVDNLKQQWAQLNWSINSIIDYLFMHNRINLKNIYLNWELLLSHGNHHNIISDSVSYYIYR